MASFKATITKAVASAFVALGDLVQVGTLTKSSVTGFDFSTGVTTGGSTAITVKVVTTDESRTEEGLSKRAIILKAGFDQVMAGDVLTVDGTKYKIADPVDNGYTIECNLKEGS